MDDLSAIDQEVVDQVAVANLTMDGPNGVIAKSMSKIRGDLNANLQRYGGYKGVAGIGGGHLAAVMNTGWNTGNYTRLLLSQVVVKWPHLPPVDALRNWLEYSVLVEFFRMASSRVQSPRDRLKEKQKEYAKEVMWRLWPTLQANGLPMVYQPLACPGALYEIGAGTWALGTATVSGTTGGNYFASITFVDMSRYVSPTNKANAESGLSQVNSDAITVNADSVIAFDITGLNPPGGQIVNALLSLAVITPLTATHWNCYVGAKADTLFLQNASPIPIATKTYALPADPILTGFTADFGQAPDCNYFMANVLQRA